MKIRERRLSSGDVAFYIDTYHKDFGRFSQKTGLQANPKNRKAYNQIKAEAVAKAHKIELELQRDPSGVFTRKAMAGDDFIEYFRLDAESKRYPTNMNTLKHLSDFTRGSLPFSSLNQQWLERFKRHLLSVDGLGQNTAGDYFGTLKTIIRKAYREGYVEINFTDKVLGIPGTDVERHFLNFDEIEILNRAKCDNSMVRAAYIFACFSGLRLSDVGSLRWEQICAVNGQYFLKFKQRKTGQWENMPLCDQAATTLKEVQGFHAEHAPSGSDKVFILPVRSQISSMLYSWGIRAGLHWRLHFHSSRHTIASLSLSTGANVFTTSKLLGHRDQRTTAIYSHSYDSDKIKAVQGFPTLSPVVESQPVALLPEVIVPVPEQKLQPRPAMVAQAGSIAEALQAKGEKIAKALSLEKSEHGRYVFNGKEFSAVELAMEV